MIAAVKSHKKDVAIFSLITLLAGGNATSLVKQDTNSDAIEIMQKKLDDAYDLRVKDAQAARDREAKIAADNAELLRNWNLKQGETAKIQDAKLTTHLGWHEGWTDCEKHKKGAGE